MDLFYLITFFLFGTIFGSFYNVVGLRIPQGNFLDSDRSYCPQCQKTLQWYELLPVLSYLAQRGKCRGCKQSISILYPMIELFTGILFALCYYIFGFELEIVSALLLVSLAIIVLVTDLSSMLIPNKILLFFLPFFIILRIVDPLDPWWSPVLGGFIGFGLLFLIIVVSKGGMGAGDMKYFGILGIVFGYQVILFVFLLSTIYGALINGILLLFKQINRKQAVPFGPYISLAAITALFVGEQVIDWYFTTFF